MSKVITLENLEVFKQECDKAYASKEEIITATVDCSHKYEITGNTGDEHGLAIDDQQMLIKKIQGHSRRKSLNFLKIDKNNFILEENTYKQTFKLKPNTSYTVSTNLEREENNQTKVWFNGTSTTADGVWNGNNRTKTSNSNGELYLLIDKNSFTQLENKTNWIMFNEGTTALPFQPYDNTLVNSNNQLISTGRNILNPDDFGAKCHTYDKATGIATIVVPRDTKKVFFENYYFAPNTQYTIILDAKTTGTVTLHNTTNLQVVYTDGTYDSLIVGTNTTNGKSIKYINRNFFDGNVTTFNVNNCAIIKGANQDFEPYKQDTITTIGALGEFDYILPQSNQKVIQTSQVVTLNGSESFREITSQALPKTKLFAYNTGLQMTGDSIVSNSKYGNAYAGIWAIDNVSIGNSENEIFIRDNFTTIDQLKQWLQQNPIQLVYKLATPTIINDGPIPNGMAVYNGGLQIQQGDVPYTITKQYNLSQKAQILANIEVDREQAKMIDEVNNKIINLPSPSITNRTVKNISINNTFPQTLTPEQTKDVFNNDLFVILSVGGSQNFYEYKNVIENPSEGKTFINISPGMKDYVSENVSFGILYVDANGYIRKEIFQINTFPVYQHSILITDEKDTRILCSIVAKKGRTISSIPDLKYLIKASGLKVVCNGFVNDKSKFHKGMAFELNTQSGDVKVKYVDLNNNSNLIYDVELNSISNLKIIDTVYDYTEANG